MADENIDVTGSDELIDPENKTVTEQVKTEKMFNQEQVNKIINERLNREKASAKKLADELESEKQNFQSTLEKYENIISTALDEMKKSVSDDVLELLGEKSVLEQYEWLMKHVKTEKPKKTIPNTPAPIENEKPVMGKKIKVF